tara:strand:+ start:9254 stop:10075 length:822 start_codon:yes stop_codon:yes gene_type:complete
MSEVEQVEQVEQVETNEVVEQEPNQEEAQNEEIQEEEFLSIDDLLELTEEDFAEFGDEANHKGMKPLHEWMQHIPEDVRKHIGNLRASYTQKTQELAAMTKQIEAQTLSLQQQQEIALNNPVFSEMKQHITDEDYDLYSEDGMAKEISRRVAQQIEALMKPAQEKAELQKRSQELETFKRQNPDLMQDEYRLPIYQLMQQREELSLEDAYWLTKAKLDSRKANDLLANQKQVRKTKRETLRSTSTGSSSAPSGTPQFKDAWSAFQYHQAQEKK